MSPWLLSQLLDYHTAKDHQAEWNRTEAKSARRVGVGGRILPLLREGVELSPSEISENLSIELDVVERVLTRLHNRGLVKRKHYDDDCRYSTTSP